VASTSRFLNELLKRTSLLFLGIIFTIFI